MSWLNWVGLMLSESAVEPRMSANSIDISTSAPPGKRRDASSHMLQKRGFKDDCFLPYNTRTSFPPTPSNGALQNLQRGSCGSRWKIRRRRLSTLNALVLNQSDHAVSGSTSLFWNFTFAMCLAQSDC